MFDLKNEDIKRIVSCYAGDNMEKSAENVRNYFSNEDGTFSIFDTLNKMGIRTIIYDNGEVPITGFFSWKNKPNVNYLILSSCRSVEQMRFDGACMFKKLMKGMSEKGNQTDFNMALSNKKFSREEKHFACAILMPRKEMIKFITQKDDKGNYLYLKDKGVLPLENVNIIADHFGVPFDQCCSRIFNISEDIKKSGKKVPFVLEGCINKRAYKDIKESYSLEQREKDMKRLVPNHNKNREKFVTCLIDSLHYRGWSKLSNLAKRRLLINLIASDSVNEGVIPVITTSEEAENEVKSILNHYIANDLKVRDGYLIGDDGSKLLLKDEQLVVIGEYEMYAKALERGFLKSYAKSCDNPNMFDGMSYKEAIFSLNENDLAFYIRSLHAKLFKKLSYKYNEQRGGEYRTSPVKLTGTDVETEDPYRIPQSMGNICWRILDILKRNATTDMSNSEYISEVNSCIYDMIRMQPFSDGNKRTCRLLSNILYQEKGIPYVFIPIKDWNNYVDAWSYKDVSKYNEMMNRLILDSYNYFYGNQTVGNALSIKNNGEKIIMANRR